VTLMSAGWIALAVAFVVIRRTDVPPVRVLLAVPTVATLALAAWMMLRLGASDAPDYGQEKLQLFVVGNLAYLIAAVIVSWRRRHLELLLVLAVSVAFVGAAVLCYQLLAGEAQTVAADRFSISATDNPISLGRDSAGGLLIGVYLMLTVRSQLVRLALAPTLLVLAVGLVASGSRGPVVGLVGGAAVFASLAIGAGTVRRRLLAVAGAAVTAILVVPLMVPHAAISRSLEVFSVSGGGLSSNGRTALWGDALTTFADHALVGIGSGGFAGIQVAEQYPHNLLLESAAELGIVGLGLVALLLADVTIRLVQSWRESRRDEDRLLAALILSLFTTAVVNSLFTGAIDDNRTVWLWAGVAVGMSAARLREPARALAGWPQRALSIRHT